LNHRKKKKKKNWEGEEGKGEKMSQNLDRKKGQERRGNLPEQRVAPAG